MARILSLILDKRIQSLLIIVAFSIAASARLSILGWLTIFGLASVAIFGIIHFVVHFYCMNNLAIRNSKNAIKIIVSHLLFASILLFQMDFDDSRSYSVLGSFFGFESKFLEQNGYTIVGIALVLYAIQIFLIIRSIRKVRVRGSNIKLLVSSILLAIILPNAFAFAAYKIAEHQGTAELEKTGEFNSIQMAIKSPDRVETLTLNPYNESLSSFPTEVLDLSNLKHLNLKGHRIEFIPNDIWRLSNLETLNLLDNTLKEINPAICECKNLVELRVGGIISSIPDCLKKMKTLKHLSFQSTYTNELLDELREFENIKTAHFYLYTDWVAYQAMSDAERQEHRKNSKSFDNKKWNKIKDETGIEHKY